MVQAERAAEQSAYSGVDTDQTSKKLQEIRAGREYMDTSVDMMVKDLSSKLGLDYETIMAEKRPLSKHGCAKELQKTFNEECFDIVQHTYSMKHLFVLSNICELIDDEQVKFAAESLTDHCRNRQTPMTDFERIV